MKKAARRRLFSFCFAGSAPVSNGAGLAVRGLDLALSRQAAVAWRALTLADRRLLSRAALFLWKMPLSATVSTIDWALAKSSVAFALSPATTAFSTFFTAVRYLERSEVFAALSLTSWRARLRPDARRGFFFLGLAEAMRCIP